jgi:hypothetical protein
MAFFHYSQNNSGGSFDYDSKAGISNHVIIEARDADEANYLAERIGLYFDGCDSGRDCDCCGDRWTRPYRDDGSEFPEVYGKDVSSGVIPSEKWQFKWREKGPEGYIHYANGSIVPIDYEKGKAENE